MNVQDSNHQAYWRRCNICKREIQFCAKYWVCNVSTCNRKRTGLVFCTVACWDAHVPVMNHRDSWAEERVAPRREEMEEMKEEPKKMETIEPQQQLSDEKEVLIVVSKLKNYIRAQSGMNTSADVMEILSDKVRSLCNDAITRAKQDNRKTVMARDFV